MRPRDTDGVEYPPPRLGDFQRSFGPSAGQDLSSPVSWEISLRAGPRHWGQSNDLTGRWASAGPAIPANAVSALSAPKAQTRPVAAEKRSFIESGLQSRGNGRAAAPKSLRVGLGSDVSLNQIRSRPEACYGS